MIVKADFLDHWKTELLIDLLDDPCAPIYVIRLWSYCQNRRTQAIPTGNPDVTKAICKASKHDAKKFHSAMITAGFIEEINGETIAHDWESVNSSLLNSWENGKKGGRPRTKTQTKPTGIPQASQTKPIRVDKSRLDEKNNSEKNPSSEIRKEYEIIHACKNLSSISFKRFYEIRRAFPDVVDIGYEIRMAALKAGNPEETIQSPDKWLIGQLKFAPVKNKPVIAQEMKGVIIC